MSLRAIFVSGVVLAGGTASLASHQFSSQFRTIVEGVAVPVSVVLGRQLAGGLTMADFRLLDNGVPQALVGLDAATVSLDLTIVAVPIESRGASTYRLREVEDEAKIVGAAMRPDDRLSLMLVGEYLTEQAWPPAAGAFGAFAPFARCTPLYDAVAAALMRPAVPGHWRLVLVLAATEGTGNIQRTEDVAAIAERSPAQFHVAIHRVPRNEHDPEVRRPWCADAFANFSADRQARLATIAALKNPDRQREPVWVEGKNRLVQLARITGGDEVPSSITGSFSGGLREVIERARSSYVLYYTPKGVAGSGWHQLEVSITKPGNYRVSHRPGYRR